jgi:hypothetical protein
VGTLLLICVLRVAKGSSPSLVVAAARFALQATSLHQRELQCAKAVLVDISHRHQALCLAHLVRWEVMSIRLPLQPAMSVMLVNLHRS